MLDTLKRESVHGCGLVPPSEKGEKEKQRLQEGMSLPRQTFSNPHLSCILYAATQDLETRETEFSMRDWHPKRWTKNWDAALLIASQREFSASQAATVPLSSLQEETLRSGRRDSITLTQGVWCAALQARTANGFFFLNSQKFNLFSQTLGLFYFT